MKKLIICIVTIILTVSNLQSHDLRESVESEIEIS